MRTSKLAGQPILTGLILILRAILEGANTFLPQSGIPFTLLFGLPLLLVEIIMYFYTVVFVAMFITVLRSLDNQTQWKLFLVGSAAAVLQAIYLLWPVARVLGPETFEEVLFTQEDLFILVPVSIATIVFLYSRGRLNDRYRGLL